MPQRKKLPWFKFFPTAWRNDPDLRRCSPGARGVWIDMLCIAFECPVRGVFASCGLDGTRAWTKREIAEAVGGDINANLRFIDELLRKGVASQHDGPGADEAGPVPKAAIYSRRMLADERKRILCAEAGRKGGGNPTLKGDYQTFKGVPKGEVKGGLQNTFDSPLTSNVCISPEGLGGAGEGEKPPSFRITDSIPGNLYASSDFLAAWLRWKAYNAQRGKPLALLTISAQLQELAEWGPEVAVAAIENSIRGNWSRLIPPEAAGARTKPVSDAERGAKAKAAREARRARLGGDGPVSAAELFGPGKEPA